MKVTLRTKPLSNGTQSLYLDVYDKGINIFLASTSQRFTKANALR